MSNGTSHEQLRKEAQESVQQGGNVREKVRGLTLRMLSRQPLESGQIRDVVRAMTEGIAAGASATADARRAVSEAFRGLDDALSRSAEAARLAVQELSDKGRRLSETTLRQGIDDLRRMEQDFLATVEDVASRSQDQARSALDDFVAQARRAGTESGRKAAEAASALSSSMGALAMDSAKFGMEAVREAGERFAEMASGVLAGMADAISPRPAVKFRTQAKPKAKPRPKTKAKAKAKAKTKTKRKPARGKRK